MNIQNRILRVVYAKERECLIASDVRGRVHKFDLDLNLIQSSPVVTYDRPVNSLFVYGEYVFTKDRFGSIGKWDLDTLEPHIVGPHTPDLARPVSAMAAAVEAEGYPAELSSALVGSCTNSSYEDITRTASIARQAASAGLRVKTPLLVTPGSERVRATIERDGLLADLEAIGATVLANACGPCIGQWKRDDVEEGDVNVIVNSYNRGCRSSRSR